METASPAARSIDPAPTTPKDFVQAYLREWHGEEVAWQAMNNSFMRGGNDEWIEHQARFDKHVQQTELLGKWAVAQLAANRAVGMGLVTELVDASMPLTDVSNFLESEVAPIIIDVDAFDESAAQSLIEHVKQCVSDHPTLDWRFDLFEDFREPALFSYDALQDGYEWD